MFLVRTVYTVSSVLLGSSSKEKAQTERSVLFLYEAACLDAFVRCF